MCVCLHKDRDRDRHRRRGRAEKGRQSTVRGGIHIVSIISNDFQHVNSYMTLYPLCETKMNE